MLTLNSNDGWSKKPRQVRIDVPKERWFGRVLGGHYALITPHMHSKSQMIPLPAVRRLMANGDLPYIRFGKESYVLVRRGNTRMPWDASGSVED
jgi:hypothetical protein